MQFCRDTIADIDGYTPGEQPGDKTYVKLNTNENPYPPSPRIQDVLNNMTLAEMALYPNPTAEAVREEAAGLYGVTSAHILCGNGSDDLLTMAVRTFVDQGGKLACFVPSYSLYPVLAGIQGAEALQIPLNDDFTMPPPEDILEQAEECSLLFVTRPNAPTANAFDKEKVKTLCRDFAGIVWIDEAYVDFAADDCLDFVENFPNVVVSRSLSKSYSLAGIRFGLAIAHPDRVHQMMKVKDSYNVNMLTQRIALAALQDQQHMKENVARIRATRERVAGDLERMGFEVLPSQANFLFVKPPKDAKAMHEQFREEKILLRYFPGPVTEDYIRITIGTDADMDLFLQKAAELISP